MAAVCFEVVRLAEVVHLAEDVRLAAVDLRMAFECRAYSFDAKHRSHRL